MPIRDLETDQRLRFAENRQRVREQRELLAKEHFANAVEQEVEEDNVGLIEDVAVRGVIGGVRDAGVNTLKGIVEADRALQEISPFPRVSLLSLADKYLGENKIDEGLDSLPDVEDPEGVVGGMTKGLTQFLAGFIPISRAAGGLQAATKYGGIAKAATYGAAADYAVFDPYEARLSDMAKQYGGDSWVGDNPIVNYLAVDENDSAIEGRIKNVIEGAGLGLAADGLLIGYRGFRAWRKGVKESDLTAAQKAEVIARGQDVLYHRDLVKETEELVAAVDEAVQPTVASKTTLPGDDGVPGGARAPVDRDGSELVDLDGTAVPVNTDGTITAYHRTSAENAARIEETGHFVSEENTGEAFFSTLRDGQATGHGEVVVEVRLDPSAVRVDDAFHGGEVHIAAEAGSVRPSTPHATKPAPVDEARFEAEAEKLEERLGRPLDPKDEEALRAKLSGEVEAPAFPEAPPEGTILPDSADALTLWKIRNGIDPGTLDARRVRAWKEMGLIAEKSDGSLSVTRFAKDEELEKWADATPSYPGDPGDAELNLDIHELQSRTSMDRDVGELSPEELEHATRAAEASLPPEANQAADAVRAGLEEKLKEARAALAGAEENIDAWRGTQEYADLPDDFRAQLEEDLGVPRTENTPETPSKSDGPLSIRNTDGEVDPERVADYVASRITASRVPIASFDEEVNGAIKEALESDDTSILEYAIAGDNTNLTRLNGAEEIVAAVGRIAEVISDVGGPATTKNKTGIEVSLEEQERLATKAAQDFGLDGTDGVVNGIVSKVQSIAGTDISTTMTAARSLYQGMVENASRLADEIVSNGGTVRQQAEFTQRLAQLHAFGDLISGATTNIGRGLGSYRILAESLDPGELAKALDPKTLGEDARKAALHFQLAKAAGPKAVREAALDASARAKGVAMALEYFMGSILSGPMTHAVNITGNSVASAWRVSEYVYNAGTDMDAQRANLAMIQAMSRNFVGALRIARGSGRDVIEAAGRSFIGQTDEARRLLAQHGDDVGPSIRAAITGDEQLIQHSRQFDFEDGAITRENFGIAGDTRDTGANLKNALGTVIDVVGNVVRIPFHLLGGADEAFKAMAYNGAIARKGYLDAVARDVDPSHHIDKLASDIRTLRRGDLDASDEYIKQLEELDKLSKLEAREATFTEELTGSSKDIQNFANKHPAARLFIPFVRTPMNLLKFSFERFPVIRKASRRYKDAVEAGDEETLALMNSRAQVGGGIMAVVGYAVMDGRITGGGPSDRAAKAQLIATGWQPYSIVFENDDGSKRYISYKRIDPLASTIGIIADTVEIVGDLDEVDTNEILTAIGVSLSENITNKSYFSGITSFTEVVSSPDRNFERVLRSFAGTIIPNFFNQTNQTLDGPFNEMDPGLREVKSVVDKLRSRTPGLSADLPPVRNMFGEKIVRPPGVGLRVLSPFYRSEGRNTNLDHRLAELAKNNVAVASMYRSFKSIKGVELTSEQRDRFIVLSTTDTSGHTLRSRLERVVETQKFINADISEDGRGKIIKEEIARWKTKGVKRLLRDETFGEEIREKIQTRKQEKREALRNNNNPLQQLLNP